ncbi:MAG: carboxymuconolactone decarboxylase family protein [Planctomycetota bacterium]
MPRISPLAAADAQGQAATLFDGIRKKVGKVPNLYATMGHAPTTLAGLLGLKQALGGGSISMKDQERIALLAGEVNGCHYCVDAHTVIGKMNGLTVDQTLEARQAKASDDANAQAILTLAAAVLEKQGHITDDQFAAAKDAGLSEATILEVVGQVVLNIFTNYVNHVIDTESDFPAAPKLG